MSSSDSDDRFKSEFERLGEGFGQRLGRRFSVDGAKKSGRIGKKLGGKLGGQMGRFSAALEEETVSEEEKLGVGGKIGTGVGVLGKQALERQQTSSRYAAMAASVDLASEGRNFGAKVEKMTKKKIASGIRGVRKRFFRD